jgi:putative transposase
VRQRQVFAGHPPQRRPDCQIKSILLHLKYECVYLHAFETGLELRAGLSWWIDYYNARRPHSTLAGRTPDEAYGATEMERLAA